MHEHEAKSAQTNCTKVNPVCTLLKSTVIDIRNKLGHRFYKSEYSGKFNGWIRGYGVLLSTGLLLCGTDEQRKCGYG